MTFTFPDQISVERTPDYWDHEKTPEQLHALVPDVKLILAVREPACRMASGFYFDMRLNQNGTPRNLTFDELVTDPKQVERRAFYYNTSLYDVHFARWPKYFSMSQFLVVKNEDFRTMKFDQILYLSKILVGIVFGSPWAKNKVKS